MESQANEESPDETAKECLRKPKEIIRTLRIRHGIPIVSSREGYWLPENVDQINKFLVRYERESRARIRASIETYRALQLSYPGIVSKYFDRLEAALNGEVNSMEEMKNGGNENGGNDTER